RDRRDRALERRRAAPHARLRGDDARRVRPGAAADRADRRRAAAAAYSPPAAGLARSLARPPQAPARLAGHGRRADRAGVPQPQARPAEARPDPRRLRLDGVVLARAPAL